MSTWVDCTAASNYTHGWVADMGLYTGPWPLLPPGVIDAGADTRPEFDFYVMLPNPSDVTDVTIIGDGSYNTPIWDAYRVLNSPGSDPVSSFDYYGDWIGPGPLPGTPPAGVHLYVVYYRGTGTPGAPPNPPEYYVPPSYAVGGTSAFETAMGAWSSSQAAFSQNLAATRTTGDAYFARQDVTYSGNENITTAVPAQASALVSTTPETGSIWPQISVTKRSLGNTTDAFVRGNVAWNQWDGTSALGNDEPLLLSGGTLVYDRQWSDTPYIDSGGSPGPGWQYSSAATWSWGCDTNGTESESYDDVSSGETLPLGLKTQIGWVSATTISGRPVPISCTVLANRVSPGAPSSTPPSPFTFDYSSITALDFVLVQQDYLLVSPTVALSNNAMDTSFDDGPIVQLPSPRLLVDRSTWQYWVPGAIVSTTPGTTGYWGIPLA